ncbi:nose resistant to fluoxetine protein 6-like [Sabethes cyaneus]|uniref:nose resistant to fluoxetine protein 6-like n=1 Tax=Sabethes cyaneus TaxID=53552 RepID=UPI00237E6631|nr:nose resistant to fluoxetine protein 6-like [Sabethes cyaneus]
MEANDYISTANDGDVSPPTIDEVIEAIKQLKNNMIAGKESNPTELFQMVPARMSICQQNSAIIPPLFRLDKYEQYPSVYCSVAVHLQSNGSELEKADYLSRKEYKSKRGLLEDFRRDYLEWGIYVQNCETELASVNETRRQQLYHPKFPINYPESNKILTGFRRDLLEWGICIADCETELGNITHEIWQQLYQPKLNSDYSHMLTIWKEQSVPFREKYDTLINVCVNNRLQRDYNLTQHGSSEILYCVNNDPSEQQSRGDWWTEAFMAVTLILISTVLITSVIDLFVADSSLKDHLLVRSFAIRRNWARLLEQPNNEIYRDFGYIDGLRIFINIFTLIVHCLSVSAILPQSNPEQGEKILQNPTTLPILASTHVSVQSFFVITGMLQMANFMKDIQANKVHDSSYFRSKIVNRFIRLLPVYYFFLLFTIACDNLPGLNMRFAGYLSMTTERYICRRHGWKNLLFINNLPDLENESCFLHGWYLAADQQLFLFSLVLLALIWKFPKSTNVILWMTATTSIIVPAIIAYCLGVNSLPPFKLAEIRLLFYYQPWFNHIYQTAYNNLNATAAGLIVGYLYHQSKIGKLNPRRLKLSTSVIVLAVLGTIPLFYENVLPRPSVFNTLHFILFRSYGVLGISVYFLHCFLTPPGVFRRILSSRLLTSLGKLSYCVYVLHVPLLRVMMNYIRIPVEISHSSIAILSVALVIASYMLGLVTYLVIEQPSSVLLKHWYSDSRKVKTS